MKKDGFIHLKCNSGTLHREIGNILVCPKKEDSVGFDLLKNGNAVVLNEILSEICKIKRVMNPEWVENKASEFMCGLIFPLVIMRDLDMFIDAENLLKIKAQTWEEDFKNVKKIDFNFEALRSYASFQSAINLFYLFRELLNEKSFVNKLSSHYNYRKASDLYKTYLFPLEFFLTNHGIDLSDAINIPDYFAISTPEQRKENNYAIDLWIESLMTAKCEYPFINEGNIDIANIIENGETLTIDFSIHGDEDFERKFLKLFLPAVKAAVIELVCKNSSTYGFTIYIDESIERASEYKNIISLIGNKNGIDAKLI